jgi:hypothetical protein
MKSMYMTFCVVKGPDRLQLRRPGFNSQRYWISVGVDLLENTRIGFSLEIPDHPLGIRHAGHGAILISVVHDYSFRGLGSIPRATGYF